MAIFTIKSPHALRRGRVSQEIICLVEECHRVHGTSLRNPQVLRGGKPVLSSDTLQSLAAVNKSQHGAVLEDIAFTLRQERQREPQIINQLLSPPPWAPRRLPAQHSGPRVTLTLSATKTPHRPPPMSRGPQSPGPDAHPEGLRSTLISSGRCPLSPTPQPRSQTL